MTCPLPLHAQKRMMERMNKTLGCQSKISLTQNQERGKLQVLKKILVISSIKQEVKRVLLKYLETGSKALTEENNEAVLAYARSILDNDRQKQLGEDLKALMLDECDQVPTLFKLVKELVISPLEKSYIGKIEKELRQDEKLDEDIQTIEAELASQKAKKLKEYESQKSGLSTVGGIGRCNSREAQNFENKLMRANQKLNELSSNNGKLREKINQLRKEKNAMEDIYSKLKKQLQSKKENVEKTIKFAGEAYCSRNRAEEDLRSLKEQSEIRKEQFREECQRLNAEIQHDLRFKQFIKSKEVERQQLQKLQREIEQNQSNIQLKKEENFRIDQEYKRSLEKEQQIKRSFDRIKKEIGYGDSPNAQNRELLQIFLGLYEKNIIMKEFVGEITSEVAELEARIQAKKAEIQKMYLKGTAEQGEREKLNEDYKKKFEFHEKKKRILDLQYEKSSNSLQTIKKYLEDIFEEIAIDPDTTDKLRTCNLNEENLTEFLGELEKKGLQAISHYGKLVSEQLRAQKGAGWEIQKQIDELNNIITLQNLNAMNSGSSKPTDYPSELLIKLKQDRIREQQLQKPLTTQQLKKFALQSLEQYQKKQLPKEKHLNKKYNIAPMLGKSKKKT